jgi:anthranilate phosphoribosyltransferase
MSASLKPSLAALAAGTTLSESEAETLFTAIMTGEATSAQIAAALTAMRVRGETREEVTGAVRAMRAQMLGITAPEGAIDVCGTGGDGFATLNVSTAVAFVVAACGVPVAKHGNRALSSRSGAADVLACLGIGTDTKPARLEALLRSPGLAFLFAPNHHPALRHAAAARAELGFRTLFNLLGPLSNPAGVTRQLTGVYHPDWLVPMAETLGALGTETAWLLHGAGLDELSLAGPTDIVEWRRGKLRRFTVTPEEAGLAAAPVEAIRGGTAPQNAAALLALLQGEKSAYRATVLLNAAAALTVADRAACLREAVGPAAAAIDSGAALNLLETMRRETQPETMDMTDHA